MNSFSIDNLIDFIIFKLEKPFKDLKDANI